MPAPYVFRLWWPWIKNYHGEPGVGQFAQLNYTKHIWIDQDLKEEMTGRR
jgi:hypothetical protein